MPKLYKLSTLLPWLAVLVAACGKGPYAYEPFHYQQESYSQQPTATEVMDQYHLDSHLQEQILNLDPENITDEQVQNILSHAPAPRIIALHGGLYPAHERMTSMMRFLHAMGYPQEKLRSPVEGYYSLSGYEPADQLAGQVAWYYEREALRPMIIGYSQGGIQAVKVTYKLNRPEHRAIAVYNPLTGNTEARTTIIDPLTGQPRSVSDLSLPYVATIAGGGAARWLPNQWDMLGNKLRRIPDNVDEYSNYYTGLDFLGGDFLGYGVRNIAKPQGDTVVRNIRIPTYIQHMDLPVMDGYAEDPTIRAWINDYRANKPVAWPPASFSIDNKHNVVLAADAWYSIKKHWALEAQRLIKAKQAAAA